MSRRGEFVAAMCICAVALTVSLFRLTAGDNARPQPPIVPRLVEPKIGSRIALPAGWPRELTLIIYDDREQVNAEHAEQIKESRLPIQVVVMPGDYQMPELSSLHVGVDEGHRLYRQLNACCRPRAYLISSGGKLLWKSERKGGSWGKLAALADKAAGGGS
jgi:hypothetical protein